MIRRIVVVFQRLGPYHAARLAAAARLASERSAEVVALEVARTDRTYGWRPLDDALPFRRITLAAGDYEALGRRELRRRLHEALDREQPDAVALPGWSAPEAVAGLAWCRRRGAVAVLMTESARHDFPRLWWREAWKRRRVARFDAALAGGAAHAAYARELGVDPTRIFLGYDVVDNEYFRRGAAEARRLGDPLRLRLGLPDRYWICACRLVRKKNVNGLLEGFARYAARAGDAAWNLVLCGDGPLRDSLARRAAALAVASRVQFLGFVGYDTLPSHYAFAQGLILASTVEQWGLVVNEAMACGLPVLVSRRCGCVGELVREGVNGRVFDPRSPASIAACLEWFAALPEAARQGMGEASSRLIAAWGPDRFAEGLWQAVEAGWRKKRGDA